MRFSSLALLVAMMLLLAAGCGDPKKPAEKKADPAAKDIKHGLPSIDAPKIDTDAPPAAESQNEQAAKLLAEVSWQATGGNYEAADAALKQLEQLRSVLPIKMRKDIDTARANLEKAKSK